MKRYVCAAFLALAGCCAVFAQRTAQITFDTLTVNMGVFGEDDAVRHGKFVFTNTGTAPLVIQNVMASCGCTTPSYPRVAIQPGEKGAIEVTYDGEGRFPGPFKKTVNVQSNDPRGITRLFIVGEMLETKK